MKPFIEYRYRDVGEALADELLRHVDAGESFILLGYQGCGKRYALTMLGRRLTAQERTHLSVIFQDNRPITMEGELLEMLKSRLRAKGTDCFFHPLQSARSLEEWFRIFANATAGHPVPTSFANLDMLSDTLKARFLSLLRTAVEDRRMIAGLTGEGILARTLARETSPFQCVHQYVLRGHDQEATRAFFLKRVQQCRIKFSDPADPIWNDEEAFRAFYARTSGNVNVLRALLWCLSERRMSFGADPEGHPGFPREAANRDFLHQSLISLFKLRPFHDALTQITIEPEALDAVERLLDKVDDLRASGHSLESVIGQAAIPESVHAPTTLELTGFLVRSPQDGQLRFSSLYVWEFSSTYFSWSCRGDFHAKQGYWEKAFSRWEKVEARERRFRPLSQRDFPNVQVIVNRLCREFSENITHSNGLNRMERLLGKAGALLFGLKLACPIRLGDSGRWETYGANQVSPPKLHEHVEGMLATPVSQPAKSGMEPVGEMHFDGGRRTMLVVMKNGGGAESGHSDAPAEPLPRHAVLLMFDENSHVIIEPGSLRHRMLETFGGVFLTCYNEARAWQRARGSRLRLGTMLERLFSGTTVNESLEALGGYLYTEFKASGVRLFLIDSHDKALRSTRCWGIADPELRVAFNSGKLRVLQSENPTVWRSLHENKVVVHRWVPSGAVIPDHKSSISFTKIEHDTFAIAEEKQPGDYWIDFPLRVNDQPYGKLSFGFPAHMPPAAAWLSDLEVISKILDQHLIRLSLNEVRMAESIGAQQRAISTVAHDLATRIASLPIFLAEYKELENQVRGRTLTDLKELNQWFEARLAEALEVLETAKQRLKAVRPVLSRFDLYEVARGALRSIDPQKGGGRVRLITPTEQTSVMVNADKSLLTGVFMELVSDAGGMACPERRLFVEISLTPDPANGRLMLEFEDNGAGVPPEYKTKIFDYFFSHRPGQKPGLGMGLGFVREVITAHGGTITETGRHGQGVHFEICLPILAVI